jgi:hypothetical protein
MNDITLRQDAGTTLAVRTDVDRDVALDLLAYVARWDNRKPSGAMAEAWAISAHLAGWTQAEAEEAVRYHQTHTREYLTPAMVTVRIESQRRRSRLSGDGTNLDGTRKVTFAGALQVWRDSFRAAGPNPSTDQETKAGELLEQMLDGAGDPFAVLTAAVIAGRKMSARIDWTAERLAAGKEAGTLSSLAMPPLPVEYLRDDQLDVRYASMREDFPPAWVLYDPFPAGIDVSRKSRYLRLFNKYACRAAGEPRHERCDRNLPEWLAKHFEIIRLGTQKSATKEELQRYADLAASEPKDIESRAAGWLHEDMLIWERERIAVARRWYADHPNDRPGLSAFTEVGAGQVDTYTGRAFER